MGGRVGVRVVVRGGVDADEAHDDAALAARAQLTVGEAQLAPRQRHRAAATAAPQLLFRAGIKRAE